MVDVVKIARHIHYGLDSAKSTIIGSNGVLYFSIDLGILYFWNTNLTSWDNGHKQRIRCFGRGITDIGVIAPVAWTRFAAPEFRGSNLEGIPTNLNFFLQTTGPGTVSVRLQDITNVQTLGSTVGLSGARVRYDIGALINIPTAPAELQVEVLPSGGGITVVMDSINLLTD